MQLKVHGKIESDGHLRLDVPTSLPAGEADVVLTIQPNVRQAAARRDFSDLAGRLMWRGDAVAEQRGLRDEW
ncbi:MAG TPA: hypothetical protein VG722_09995 [Tepidisphaeraceae bacterium]|nr:hypothetical protein [Tepidisphaeraceae bacterium]